MTPVTRRGLHADRGGGLSPRARRTTGWARPAAALLIVATLAAGCGSHQPQPGPTTPGPGPPGPTALPEPTATAAARYTKVMVIAEENHGYGQIIGNTDAPFVNRLAGTYGTATRMDAGYPPGCPSLPAYLLLTSGTTDGICDDDGPRAHPISGDNVFHQVAATGRQWRAYAESAPSTCALDNGDGGRYLVRHVPATYYVDERANCAQWTVPLGTPDAGALHSDIAAGALPALSFVTPDACDDMHGASPCPGSLVATGDRWLRTWLGQVLAGPDYRAGRLVVLVTWDEGTGTDNHIATLVVSPTTAHVSAGTPFTHCSTLRTVEDLLRLPLLGCAASAASLAAAFRL